MSSDTRRTFRAVDVLLQAFGWGLGASVYVLAVVVLVRGMRDTGRGAAASWRRMRREAAADARAQRVVELKTRYAWAEAERRRAA